MSVSDAGDVLGRSVEFHRCHRLCDHVRGAWPDDVNAQHAIGEQLRFTAGPGDLPFIRVCNAHAEAVVCVHGAQVLSYRPLEASADVLFLSERAHFQAGKAIRGGLPTSEKVA